MKACLQRKPDELAFAKSVALANEIEGADRAAKITTYSSGEGATSAPVLKMNPARSKGESLQSKKGSECAVEKQTTPLRNAGSAGLRDTWRLHA